MKKKQKKNALANNHLQELKNLWKENTTFKHNINTVHVIKNREQNEAVAKKVNYIKIQNEQLKIILGSREALYITLAHKEKAQTDAKEIFILFLKED